MRNSLRVVWLLVLILVGVVLKQNLCGAAGNWHDRGAVPLWADGAPDALGKADKDIPTLTPYWPEKPNGATVIVFPGGGYNVLAPHEGEPFAKWLNSLGVTAFVLKYRLNSGGYFMPTIFKDAQRAVRVVRARAGEFNLDPARIGVIGSSAGGHLIAVLSTQFDAGNATATDPLERPSCRPDFTIVCYGFINFDTKTMPDPKRREKALGPNATDELGLFSSLDSPTSNPIRRRFLSGRRLRISP